MINQEKFYTPSEHPDGTTKLRMWNNIQRELYNRKSSLFSIQDRRSFLYGIAAAFLLYFASVGVYTTIKHTQENAKPGVVRLDEAYQSAIKDFETIIPQMVSGTAINDNDKQYIEVRKEELRKIDDAIFNFKKEIGGGDCSPLSQLRLRQLYSMKLTVLQELIDKGEKEL